jgi:hypothetical protein
MRVLIARDDVQLHRIDRAIARIDERSPAEQRKMACLLAALPSEKAEIFRYSSRAPQRATNAAVAA